MADASKKLQLFVYNIIDFSPQVEENIHGITIIYIYTNRVVLPSNALLLLIYSRRIWTYPGKFWYKSAKIYKNGDF